MPAPTAVSVPAAELFAALEPEVEARWLRYGRWKTDYFPKVVGLQVDAVRDGYAEMRLPYRDELRQPQGSVHGGAIATLVDSVAVPAVGAGLPIGTLLATVSLHLQFLGELRAEDAVAVGWVTKRGRSLVFCEVAVHGASSGTTVASASLVFSVRLATPPDGSPEPHENT